MKLHYTNLETCHDAIGTSDVEHSISLDKFNFAIPISRENGRLVMRYIKPYHLTPGT